MLWVIIVILTAAVIVFLLGPFFRSQKDASYLDEEDYLTAQLADIAGDRDAGLISAEDAAAADLEARRRLLSAHRSAAKAMPKPGGIAARQLSGMLVAVAPVAAIAAYLVLGNPSVSETEEGKRIAAANRTQMAMQATSVSQSIKVLEARLDDNPAVLDDWVLLAESYANSDRFADAARAFGQARALAPDEAYLHAAEGEAIAMAAGGIVTPDARFAFDQALAIDETEPRARFYLAIGAYQEGRREEALASLQQLEREAPAGVAWLPIVRSQIEMISAEIGQTASGPTANASGIAAMETAVEDRDTSYETWIALINAYASRGELERARAVIERAKERYAGAPFVLQAIATAESQLPESDAVNRRGPTSEQIQSAESMTPEDRSAMIEGMVSGLAARLAEEPDDIEGWTMLARSYGVLNQFEESADAYARAVELDPKNLDLRIGHAESLLNALNRAAKPIDERADAAIEEVAKIDPEHPFALYFQGLAASQRGEANEARAHWTKLIAIMPAGSTEAASIQSMIDAL